MKKKILLFTILSTLIMGCQVQDIQQTPPDVNTITSENKFIYLGVGEEYKGLSIETDATVDVDLTYQSKNEDILTIDNEGIITGVSQGRTTILVYVTHKPEIELEVEVFVYNLSELKSYDGDEEWQWTSSYKINEYIADLTGDNPDEIRYNIIANSFDYLGTPYSQQVRYGPSYDCSSFIDDLYLKNYDTTVGSATYYMLTVLKNYKASFEDREIGDMLFGTDGTYNHVGIYLGNDIMIHSAYSFGENTVSSIYYGPFSALK